MPNPRPIIALTITDPGTLSDVLDWADLADRAGMADSSPVELSRHPHVSLTVRAYLDQLARPDMAPTTDTKD